MGQHMSSDEIGSLIEEILWRQRLVAKPAEEWPASTRSGNISAQRQAKDALLGLEARYASYLKEVAVVCVLEGADRATQTYFCDMAALVGGDDVVVADAAALYRRLATVAEPGLPQNRQFGAGQIGPVLEELAAVGRELFMTDMAAPRWEFDVVVRDFEALESAIRKAVRGSVEVDALNCAYMRMSVYRSAIETRHSGAILPVLVTNCISTEVQTVKRALFGTSMSVDLSGKIQADITEDLVRGVFSDLVSLAKNRKRAHE